MAESTKYNGWTNYATWRINLEMFSDCDDQFNDIIIDLRHNESVTSVVYELKDYLSQHVEEILEMECDNNLTLSYAYAFINQVNFYEIAQHIYDHYLDAYVCDNCNKELDEEGRYCSDKCKAEYNATADL